MDLGFELIPKTHFNPPRKQVMLYPPPILIPARNAHLSGARAQVPAQGAAGAGPVPGRSPLGRDLGPGPG